MLKSLIVAAGALLTVTLVPNQSASAAGYRTLSYRNTVPTRQIYAQKAYPRAAYRGARVGYAGRYTPMRYAAAPILRQRRINLMPGIAAYRTVARSRFVRRAVVAAPARMTRRVVRSLLGSRSSYIRTAAPAAVGGGQVGQASYYALTSRTANGGRVGAATCAHRYLPFGTRILVTNLANAHQMVLTVNDRGPFTGGRILDVSKSAASYLGMIGSGTAPVSIKVVGHS